MSSLVGIYGARDPSYPGPLRLSAAPRAPRPTDSTVHFGRGGNGWGRGEPTTSPTSIALILFPEFSHWRIWPASGTSPETLEHLSSHWSPLLPTVGHGPLPWPSRPHYPLYLSSLRHPFWSSMGTQIPRETLSATVALTSMWGSNSPLKKVCRCSKGLTPVPRSRPQGTQCLD